MKRNGLSTGLSVLRALTVLGAISLPTAHAQNATRATTIQATQLRKALQQAGSLPIQVPPGAVIRSGTVLTPDGAAVTLAAAGAADPAADPQRATQRKAVLSKLTFDRRPSAILKAWSAPPRKEADPATDPAADKERPKDGAPEGAAAEGAAEETTPEEKPLTDAEKKAKEEAEKTKAAAEKLAKEMEQLKADVETLKRNVTLANWPDVGTFIGSLEEDESKALYLKLLQSLLAGPPGQPKARSGQIIGERNVIRASDVIALAELCPVEKLEDTHISSLARLASLCQAEGQAEYIFLKTLEEHVAEKGEKKLDQRSAARILFMAGRIDQANSFLPDIAAADADEDLEALSILTDVFFRKYQLESDKSYLEQSWQAAQLLLAAEKADEAQQRKAMQRCVQLVPLIKEELGQQWLTDSFTSEPQQGMEIIAGIGGASAESMKLQLNRPSERVATLKLQQTAVNALLDEAPDKAKSWGSMLHLLAANWLREATYSRKYDSTTSRGPTMTRDMYGNYFYSGTSRSSSPPQGMPRPISSGEVLDVKPGEKWLTYLEPGYRSQFSIETARLHLRVKEEAEAFPYIETLAKTHPEEATELVKEFLDVWAANHNPNSERQRTSIYMFSFGYNQRAQGIPLTRSRQVRNLEELAGWVKRIRQLPLEDIDDRWISAAFRNVHSSAEVYQLSDMERVFGNTEQMEPKTLAALLQTMRMNLATIWRQPKVQQQAKTNRKQPEIEAEVVRGYKAANQLLTQAIEAHPDNWQLQLVKASMMHDENDYQAELKKSSGFAGVRKSALEGFQKAFQLYVAGVSDLKETEYSIEPLQTWFYASLGAVDLAQVNQDKQPVLAQIPLIKAAFEQLPSESREKHLAMFANDLFTRMSRVNPGVKFRYVREGLEIVGDHEQAAEARKVFTYYNDLVTEIKLEAELDGGPAVGSEQPFGLYVSLKHTKAIERESGGFAKYLQNQNSGSGYYYNYGRPTENYRDKFEQTVRDALDEHFEILSVTFQPDSVKSRATAQPDWRKTSYAYILLKARGPEIDRIAPLKLDLDFMDTSGYAVLPVESQALLVDCTTTDVRPFDQLSLTQTLDERQAKDDKLVLEVKAVAQGLIPSLDDLMEMKFADFEVDTVEDNGISVSRFDPESNQPVVVSDRLWTVTLKDKQASAEGDRQFMFASAKVPLKEELWQRYDDADLVAVEQSVTLQEQYDQPDRTAQFVAIGLAILAIAGGFLFWFLRRRDESEGEVSERFVVPADATPFNVLSLLKNIEANNGLSVDRQQELATSINRLERHFFADEKDVEIPDLQELAQTWVKKAR
ncbi:MAG: hypothetical protein NXI04_00725 [Planctomycetaceae bacterium]|nr:hypothetical protein [Planctomycetaceae bacterium]